MELRNIKWGKFIKGLLERDTLSILLKSRSLQWWLTVGFRKQGMMILDEPDIILGYKGISYHVDLINYPRIFEAYSRYNIGGIREDDTVLDIGANIGSFTLPAAKVAKKVYAVEPMFTETLKENVELNNFENVEVIDKALGADFGTLEVDCQEYKGLYNSVHFGHLLDMVGPVSVLRLDCGGVEWCIESFLLKGIRQLEIEFHFWENRDGSWDRWKDWLEEEGYGYKARWSKHKHWLYLSASKDRKGSQEVFLKDGSFTDRSKKLWE